MWLQKIGNPNSPDSSLFIEFLKNLPHIHEYFPRIMNQEQVYIFRIKVIKRFLNSLFNTDIIPSIKNSMNSILISSTVKRINIHFCSNKHIFTLDTMFFENPSNISLVIISPSCIKLSVTHVIGFYQSILQLILRYKKCS